ncbi:HD domain-containing protein [uncultured Desulfuromonas sp.]|uniref:3'-5' exoribonuclease YhaM family protein n=1 Tax=uncultured Desulfuromonas sp. TaxID=181013 RepID=UPI002AAC006D|nr:HD domain-containing protein [uncultured Desulfuromonas sp.]
MSKVFIADLKERDQIDSPFLVRDKIMAMAKNGKPYMTLKLMDRSGEVEGRIWDQVDHFSRLFNKDDFIRVRAKASVYMGKMQLVIQDLVKVDESEIALGDFLPVSSHDPATMLAQVRALISSMTDADYRGLMESFFNDAAFVAQYQKAPAAKAMHHVYLGGLLEHSLAVAHLADDVCRRYPSVDRDLLISGALLHDVGKVAELLFDRSFDYSDEGKLLGHIVIGVEMVEERIRTLGAFPRMKATLLKHLLLSHHGQYDYGSPKRPKTLEAVILNFVDDMDSKINGVQAHIDKEAHNDSRWTGYHRLYDRYFFKGEKPVFAEEPSQSDDVAPAVPVAAPAPPVAKPADAEKKMLRKRRGEEKTLSASLGEQLGGLNMDLFGSREE